jgi:hypothetical protein
MYVNAVIYGNEGNPNYPCYGTEGVKSVGPTVLVRYPSGTTKERVWFY